MNIDDYIEQTNNSNSVGELFDFFESAMADLGLDRVIFSLMTEHLSLRKGAEHGIAKNYPGHWMDHYVDEGYEHIDPVRSCMFHSALPFLWSDLLNQGEFSKSQLTLMLEGKESGLHCGLGIPLRSSRGALAGVGAASTDQNLVLSKNKISQANLIAFQFYICYQALMAVPNIEPIVTLTAREREILRWSATGKTKSGIGDELCLSKHAIDYHTRNILVKFDTNNITAAVVKALNQGLVQI